MLARNAERFIWQDRINRKPLMKSKIREGEFELSALLKSSLGPMMLTSDRAEHTDFGVGKT